MVGQPERLPPCRIGIVIKALNERAYIARAVASAQAATVGMSAVVVLADSGSTDGTVEIARDAGALVVQLADPREKSCGIGAQLGFQHLDCEFVYILDGDMELFPDFLPEAIALLGGDPGLAGVGGLVEERGEGNYEFRRRKENQDGVVVGTVEALDMGGLYRTSAVRMVGYLTNRNLHSYEEKELALRLRAAGFGLRRIGIPAVRHWGKTQSTGALLLARWKSRHLDGPGELLRSAVGSRYLRRVIAMFWRPLAVATSWLWFVLALALLPWSGWPLALPLIFNAALFLNFLRRTRTLGSAGVAFVNLQVITASLLRGMVRPQTSPITPINSVILR